MYPILDLQQLATHASSLASVGSTPTADASSSVSSQFISTADLGLTSLVEVVSLYSGEVQAGLQAGEKLRIWPKSCLVSILVVPFFIEIVVSVLVVR